MTGSRVSLCLGSCSKLPYLIVWWRIETKRTSFWLNLMIPQIPVVCCLKSVCAPSIFFIFRWHNLMTFMTVAVITWAGHTRHMTGPHTKYFPTYFYNPDIFCLPLISFLLTGCSQAQWDAWRVPGCVTHSHDIRKQPRKLMNVFVFTWHGWHPGIISLPDMRPPGTGGGDQASCVSRCLLTLWFIIKSDVHKTRALIHTGAPGAN